MSGDAPSNVPRRFVLLGTLQASILATIVAIFYPVVSFLRPRKSTVSGAEEVVAPFKVRDLPNATGNPFDFGGKPCLVVLTAEGAQLVSAGKNDQLTSNHLHAFSALCTHVDCTVKYRPQEGDIFCSCHEGVYDLNGRNVSGPPPRPLESFRVTLRGEKGQEEIVVSRSS